MALCCVICELVPGSTVRLMNSTGDVTTGSEGLLQMRVGGTWKYVCDDKFDANSNGANVACRELGYQSGTHRDGKAPVDSFFDDVECSGNETALADCPRTISENCADSEAVTLACTGLT